MLSRTKFHKYISAIHGAFIAENKKNNALKYILDDSAQSMDCTTIQNKFVSISIALLKEICVDVDDWIEYFIFEKHFGKRKDLKVYINKEEYKLETIDDLYNLIQGSNNEKQM
jgi:hypothetical protein